jgi:hydrogenase-4 component F
MTAALVCIGLPLLAALAGLLPMPVRAREAVTVAAACGCAAMVAVLMIGDELPVRGFSDYVYVDGLSLVLALTVALVYLCASVFAVGYFNYERGHRDFHIYNRRFHILFNVFAACLFLVPFSGNLMVLWIAVELTTVTSALLVGLEKSTGAAEAAWKYILIASSGLVLGLLGLTLLYFAALGPLGSHFNPTFPVFLGAASHLAPDTTRLAFALIVLGFGAKAGLVPMHTWLPDAHSEGATPVSALLSGALLADAMYGIFRVYPIVARAVGSTYPTTLLLAFGVASILLAGFVALRQTNLKRLYAYSSIEHMGILALGVGIGGPIALYGVMLHVIAHGVTKALAFFGAGSVLQRFATKDSRRVRGLSALMPGTALFVVAGGFGISGLPPSGLFRSEILIVLGAFQRNAFAVGAVLLLCVSLVFVGILRLVNPMVFTPAPTGVQRGESSRVMVVAMGLAAIPAFALGVVIPGPLDHILHAAATVVGGGR